MNRQELQQLQQTAEATQQKLLNVIRQSPELTEHIEAVLSAGDPVQEYTALAMRNPRVAEQILRISLAALGNCRTVDEVTRQLTEPTA